ncbi:MAG: hypothetical protein K1X91_14115 [Bacteriodetes bacterium]|nr:hypothetical protein [Bacteroidota bacterium]
MTNYNGELHIHRSITKEDILYLIQAHKQLPIPVVKAKELRLKGLLSEGILGNIYAEGLQDGWLVTSAGYNLLLEVGEKL